MTANVEFTVGKPSDRNLVRIIATIKVGSVSVEAMVRGTFTPEQAQQKLVELKGKSK